MNDDVVEVKTARDCARRWSHLLEAGAAAVAAHSTKLDNTNDVDDASLFDCTDLIVPTSHELINREVELGIRRWHDLASRVIMDDNDGEEHQNDDDDDDEGGTSTIMMPPRQRENDKLVDATSGGDKRKQRMMPYNFDYACKGNGGPMIMTGEDNNNGNNIHKRPRVISLLDPTQTLDYEDELYHTVFRPIHTLDELEERYALGREKIETHAQVKKKMMTTTTTTTVKQRPGRPPNAAATAAASSVVTSRLEEKDNTRSNNNNNDSNNDDNGVSMQLLPHHGCQHTYAVKRNLREWFAKYSRIDAHSLGRLRVKDRHSAPPPLRSNNGSNTTTTTTSTTYVRFEILRHSQNLKRGSGVDGSRLEVELHGEQRTLLDLHRVIVESTLNKEADGVDSIDNDNDEDEKNTSVVNGIFFIENTFYTCGQVGTHVAEAITCWLDEDSNNEGEGSTTTLLTSRRRKFLGMMPSLLPSGGNSATRIIPMSEIKLEDISLRLGVRYFHMFIPPPTPSSLRLLFHGQGHDEVDDESSSRKIHSLWSLATESAVFVTGIHTIPLSKSLSKRTDANNERKDDTIGTKHPILIHDTWSAPQRHICYACNHSPASVVTVNDELTDAAPPGLDERTNKIYLQGVPLCSSCYRAMHYCRHENTDDGNRGLTLRPSENHQAFLVLSIEEYDRLVTLSSLDDSPANAGF